MFCTHMVSAMKRKKWNYKRVAAELEDVGVEVTVWTVTKWGQGAFNPRLEHAMAAAKLLGFSLDDTARPVATKEEEA